MHVCVPSAPSLPPQAGLYDHFAQKKEGGQDKVENLRELVRSAARWEEEGRWLAPLGEARRLRCMRASPCWF
jgi:hypothetical protein